MVVLSAIGRLTLIATAICPLAVSAQQYRLTPHDVTPQRQYDFGLTAEEFSPRAGDKYVPLAEEISKQSAEETVVAIQKAGESLGVTDVDQDTAETLAAAPGIAKLPDGFRASILVTSNLGENTLKDMLDRYRLRKDVRFVFRGIPAGMTVPQFGLWLSELTALDDSELGQAPNDMNIILDPELFAETGAQLAPTIVLEDLNQPRDSSAGAGLDLGHIVARAEGFSDPDWLYSQYTKGNTDRLTNPNVVAITEEDLRVRAKREAEEVAARLTRDPDILKRRFWDRTAQSLQAMPVTPAAEDRERQLHFMFKTDEAITDHEGNILAHAGEVFQPKDVAPFDRRIFVVDPTRPEELDFIEQALATPRQGVSRVLIVATKLPPTAPGDDPWAGIEAIAARFGILVTLLNDQFRTSFQIEHTPTELFPRPINGVVEVFSREVAIK